MSRTRRHVPTQGTCRSIHFSPENGEPAAILVLCRVPWSQYLKYFIGIPITALRKVGRARRNPKQLSVHVKTQKRRSKT